MFDLTIHELLVKVAEDNAIRKVLIIILDCKDLDEAIEKIKALLNK